MRRIGFLFAAAWLLAIYCSCERLEVVEPFRAQVCPSSMDIFDGGSICVEISSNAKSLKVISIRSDYPLSHPTLGTLVSGVILDMESVGHSAYFTTDGISIPRNKEMRLSIVLEEVEYGRRLSFDMTFAFWNTPAIIPESITPGMDNIMVDCDETWSIPIIIEPYGAMGGFDFKIYKDDDAPYLTVTKNEDTGYLSITGGERGGSALIRVFSTLRPSVYCDIEVYVRNRVVIIIDAGFSRWYSNFLNESLKFKSGACDALSATLAWWSGDLDSEGQTVDPDRIKFTQCNAHEAFQPFFYYECDKYSIASDNLRNGVSPSKTDEGGFLAGAPLCWASKVNDLPLLYLGDGKNASDSQKYYLDSEKNLSSVDWYSDVGYKGKEKNVYSSFSINIRKVLFEHPECFDLRYVYHRYKQTAEGRYWWHSRDDKRQLYKMSNGYLVSPYNT